MIEAVIFTFFGKPRQGRPLLGPAKKDFVFFPQTKALQYSKLEKWL